MRKTRTNLVLRRLNPDLPMEAIGAVEGEILNGRRRRVKSPPSESPSEFQCFRIELMVFKMLESGQQETFTAG